MMTALPHAAMKIRAAADARLYACSSRYFFGKPRITLQYPLRAAIS